MREILVDCIRRNSGALTSVDLAERFLKCKDPNPSLAHRAVAAILDGDRRCRMERDGRWYAVASSTAGAPLLRQLPWAAVYAVVPEGSRDIHHVAVWAVYPTPHELYSAWLKDPSRLTPEEGMLVAGRVGEGGTGLKPHHEVAAALASVLEKRIPVYTSWRQQALCAYMCACEAEALNDNSFVISRLMRAAGCAVPHPLSIEKLQQHILGYTPPSMILCHSALHLASCVAGVIDLCACKGIETLDALEKAGVNEISADQFVGKEFALCDLVALPPSFGVYMFLGADGSCLYIGKSTNLRNRLLGYFRPSEESPRKLERLRAESHRLIIHRCGSELESLLLEYRLIREYRPLLNAKCEIHPRGDSFRPVDDCVVLLPHADREKGMSFWVKRGRKIAIRAFDLPLIEKLAGELHDFFFSEELTYTAQDLAELEIATRWIRRHEDTLVVVPVHALARSQEVVEAMSSAWEEMER